MFFLNRPTVTNKQQWHFLRSSTNITANASTGVIHKNCSHEYVHMYHFELNMLMTRHRRTGSYQCSGGLAASIMEVLTRKTLSKFQLQWKPQISFKHCQWLSIHIDHVSRDSTFKENYLFVYTLTNSQFHVSMAFPYSDTRGNEIKHCLPHHRRYYQPDSSAHSGHLEHKHSKKTWYSKSTGLRREGCAWQSRPSC
jgi:hypothetical protein